MLGRLLRPRVAVAPVTRTAAWAEVLPRMAAGAALTLAVTWLAAPVGPRWSGVLAVFPLLSTVVAADTHRRHGGAYAAALLSAMVDAFWAFAVFCVALVLLLDRVPAVPAFVAAVARSTNSRRRSDGSAIRSVKRSSHRSDAVVVPVSSARSVIRCKVG